VHTWLHNGFLNIDEKKMSKSLGNFFTMKDVLARFDAEVVRFFLLSSHYRSPINFSDAALAESERRVEYLFETMRRLQELGEAHASDAGDVLEPARVDGGRSAFEDAMDDDFNTAAAIGHLSDLTRFANELLEKPQGVDKQKAARTLRRLRSHLSEAGSVLGLFQAQPDEWLSRQRSKAASLRGIDPARVAALIDERSEARKAKDFARADRVRETLKEMGVVLEDTAKGTRWKVGS
jgi:cysteinyl-tRNA synthetase